MGPGSSGHGNGYGSRSSTLGVCFCLGPCPDLDLRGGSDYCLYLQEIPEWFPSHFAASGNTETHNPSGRLVPGPRDTRCSPQISLLPDPASQHRWGESLKWPTLPLHPSSPHGRGSQYLPELPTVACALAESCKWYRNKMQHVKAASLLFLLMTFPL